ncbi:hypothetical protein D9M68_564500 [compost metagenome]
MLAAYTGTYVSDELECAFKIEVKEGSLYMSNKTTEPVKITLAGRDHLFMEDGPMNHVLIRRDKKGRITSFEFKSGDTSGMLFKKS